MESSFSPPARLRLLPGLVLTALLTTLAYSLDRLPGLGLLGTLGLALVLGLVCRAVFGLPKAAAPGVTFSAKTLLNLGVILLGVRLNFALLYAAGPAVLLLDLLVVGAGMLTIERLGKRMGLTRGLRLALAVGSSICGPSAIAAAVPIIGANDDEVSVAVGTVSLLGALGAVGYILLAPLLELSPRVYGLMTGATLQSVGHVLAAGAAGGAGALDLATLTKLTRVALLAPVLLVVGWLLARYGEAGREGAGREETGREEAKREGAERKGKASGTKARPPLLPGFLIGFLALGALNSFGVIPRALINILNPASVVLTTAAMAGIGLGVNFGVLRRIGGGAAALALLGFGMIIAIAALYMVFIPV